MAQEKVRVLLPSQALNISEKLQDRNSAASPPGANNDTEGQGSPAGGSPAKKQGR